MRIIDLRGGLPAAASPPPALSRRALPRQQMRLPDSASEVPAVHPDRHAQQTKSAPAAFVALLRPRRIEPAATATIIHGGEAPLSTRQPHRSTARAVVPWRPPDAVIKPASEPFTFAEVEECSSRPSLSHMHNVRIPGYAVIGVAQLTARANPNLINLRSLAARVPGSRRMFVRLAA